MCTKCFYRAVYLVSICDIIFRMVCTSVSYVLAAVRHAQVTGGTETNI